MAENIEQTDVLGGGDATTEYTNTVADGGYADPLDVDEGAKSNTILFRRDTEKKWEEVNPVLGAGEMGVVIDKRYFKIGDGNNAWNSLKTYDVGVDIVQDLGDSETAVMSQKAVENALTEVGDVINVVANNLGEQIIEASNETYIIKNTMSKSCVSENIAFNDVVKELYFDHKCNINNISQIDIKRNGVAGSNIVWEMYLIDSNGESHWISFGSKAESQDVNVAKVGWKENVTSALFEERDRSKVRCYAVIDWNKVTDRSGTGVMADTFATPMLLNKVNYIKYFPQINTCIATHKYAHGVEANSIIKELYFENLTRNGTPISEWDLEHELFLQRIDRRVEYNGKILWQLVFGVKNDSGSGDLFIYTENNPETNNVWSMTARTTVGDITYSCTIYAVIDWSKIGNGKSLSFNEPLLGGCLKLNESPIINDYISSRVTKVKWSDTFNLNDYKTQGIYYISGERLSNNDNLPISNAASGHTISGQLTVLDASLSDAERCVTQYLKLSNRWGSEGKEFVRTYNRYIDGVEKWGVWKEVKQTANLNQISDGQLKNYTENGTYEGVIVNSTDVREVQTEYENFFNDISRKVLRSIPSACLFSMEVMNNYAVVEKFNAVVGDDMPPTIVQKIKFMPIGGEMYEAKRSCQDGSWTSWNVIY